jgi:hypothetical protein
VSAGGKWAVARCGVLHVNGTSRALTDPHPGSGKKVVKTDNAPAAVGPYSQGIRAGKTLYVSGCIGLHPKVRGLCITGSPGRQSKATQPSQLKRARRTDWRDGWTHCGGAD